MRPHPPWIRHWRCRNWLEWQINSWVVSCLQWRSGWKLNTVRQLGTSWSVVMTLNTSQQWTVTATSVMMTSAWQSVRWRRRRYVNRLCTRHHRTIHAHLTTAFLSGQTHRPTYIQTHTQAHLDIQAYIHTCTDTDSGFHECTVSQIAKYRRTKIGSRQTN